MKRTKILLSAYSCEPGRGSEPGVGWNVARSLARHHDVWVLTRGENRPAIEAELARRPVVGLRFHFHDVPGWPAGLDYDRHKYALELHYYLWQLGVFFKARALHRRIGFDLTQHVTYVRYWMPSLLALLPVPFVWGPVGGGESAPPAFDGQMTRRARIFERIRDVARRAGEFDPLVRITARRSALAFATTEETADRMRRLGAPRVVARPACGLSAEEIEALRRLPDPAIAPIRFLSMGRLLQWKGFHLGLQAFAEAGISDAEYWIVGEGPERERLERLARALGIENRVRFFGALPRNEALARLGASHVVVHPSLHDSGGLVCMEAMAARRPVLCLDLGGPGALVSPEAGFKIRPESLDSALSDLSGAMRLLAVDPGLRATMGAAGLAHVETKFSWTALAESLSGAYAGLIAPAPTPEHAAAPRRRRRLVRWAAAFLLQLTLLAAPALAQQCTFHRDCGTGRLCDDGTCRAVEAASAAPGGTVFWVDRDHPAADDRSPGTRERPWKTIGRADASLRPGDAVIVRAGTYRERLMPRSGGTGRNGRVTYAAYPGDEVIVTGADPLDGRWTRQGGAWCHSWTRRLMAYGEREMRRELVVFEGRVLTSVYRRDELRAGTFYVEGSDEAPTAICVRLPGDADPNYSHVEAAVRHPLFWPTGPNANAECGDTTQPGWFRVIGFTFRHAANRAQWGAVCPGSEGSLLEENTIEWTNGLGLATAGRNHDFRGNRTLDNGQMGMGGSCTGCLLEYNESSRNNWKGHSPFWEAGGGKWVRTRNTVIRHHLARDNRGPGIWFDIDNADNVIEYSVAAGNEVAGVMLELETVRTVVRGNVIHGTRRRGWSGTGLLTQAAGHNIILHNTIVANEGAGVWLRLDPDRRAPDGHNVLYNNLIAGNVTAANFEAREISIDGLDLAHARTNRLDGNLYGRQPSSMSVSTFYFSPDAASPANFRSGDVERWRHLTQGDASGGMVDPMLPLLTNLRSAEGCRPAAGSQLRGSAVDLPPHLRALVERIAGSHHALHDVGAPDLSPTGAAW